MTARPVLLPSGSGLIRQIWLTCGRGGTGHTPTASLWLPASAPMASAAAALGRPQCARATTNTNSMPTFPRVPAKQLPGANYIFHAHQRHLIKWQPPQCFPSRVCVPMPMPTICVFGWRHANLSPFSHSLVCLDINSPLGVNTICP